MRSHHPHLALTLLALFGFGLFLLFRASPARAAASCAATTVSNVNFGSPSLLAGGTVDTSATLSISCSGMKKGTLTYCLSLGAGSGGTSGTTRLMTATGGANLQYNLYQDAARTIPWGSKTNTALGIVGAFTFDGGSSPTGSFPIYGRILSGQNAAKPVSYSSAFSGADSQFYALTPGATDCVTGALGPAPAISPPFSVLASPIANCTVSAGSLSFGTRGSLASNTDVTGSVNVACTNTTPYTVGLGNGLTGTSPSARIMTSGSNQATYVLYSDSARTIVWSATTTVGSTGTGSTISHIVYGRVPGQTTPAPGAYSDSVVVTVTY